MFEKFKPENLGYPNNTEDDKLAKEHGIEIESIENELSRLEQGYLTEEALLLTKEGVVQNKEDLTEEQIVAKVEKLDAKISVIEDKIDTLKPEQKEEIRKWKELLDRVYKLRNGIDGITRANFLDN